MKYKITDLMDLYEDPKCPFDPSVDQGQKIETQKETIEVKQTKHRFGWKEGLSLAAALAIVVLGGFGVKRFMDRRAVPPVESSFSPGMAESSSSPKISEPEFTAPDPNVVKPLLNPLLTAFAQQYISDSDQNLAGEYELACFAHLYAKLNDREAIRYQTEGDDPYETLSLEQVNETLTRLLGKTVSPEEGTDYTLQRGDNYAIHEQYHDGTFWWPAADGDPHDAFAIGYILDNQPYDREGRIVLSVAFTVYEPTDFDTDIAPLLLLTPEEAQAKAESGALRFVSDGQAWVEYVEDHLQMVQYELIDADPDTPHTDPTGFDSVPDQDWIQMNVQLTEAARTGFPEIDAAGSFASTDDWDVSRFALATALIDRSSDTYEVAFEAYRADTVRWPEFLTREPAYIEDVGELIEEGMVSVIGCGTASFEQRSDGICITGLQYTALDGDQETNPDADPLLAELKELFETPSGWYSRCLSSRFAEPADVNLFELFYDGCGTEHSYDDPLTKEELTALFDADSLDENGNFLGPCIDRLTSADMNKVLTQYFGLTLEQTRGYGLGMFQYLPETGYYYHTHGDTNIITVKVTAARRLDDGTVLLTYPGEEYRVQPSPSVLPLWTAALQPLADGGYQILSNLPGEWTTAADAGSLISLYKGFNGTAEIVDADGTRLNLELTLGIGGSVSYEESDPSGNVIYRESGGWWLPDDQTLGVEHRRIEGYGYWAGENVVSYYHCEIRDGQLILTQQSEIGLHNDKAGTELRFQINKE